MNSKGIGDTIEEILKKSGVKYVANKIIGEDCGCNKRKEKLNQLFPYNKSNFNKQNEKK